MKHTTSNKHIMTMTMNIVVKIIMIVMVLMIKQ